MKASRDADESLALASKFRRKHYLNLENLSALDWFIQFAVRRDCFAVLRNSAKPLDRNRRKYRRLQKFLEMLATSPVLSLSQIVSSGFALYEFPTLLRFFSPENSEARRQRKLIQPIRYRDLDDARIRVHVAGWSYFREWGGPLTADRLTKQWMSGEIGFPADGEMVMGTEMAFNVEWEGSELLLVDTTASNEDLRKEFGLYLEGLEQRNALGGEQTRAPRIKLPKHRSQDESVMPLGESNLGSTQLQEVSQAETTDAFKTWINFLVMPCMDLMLWHSLTSDCEAPADLLASALTSLFRHKPRTWDADSIKTVLGHIARLRHPRSRLFGELERVALDELISSSSTIEFRRATDLIQKEILRWNKEQARRSEEADDAKLTDALAKEGL
jgi:hypothetical protein